MCGIAGILNKHGSQVDPGELERMSRAITHRGPDGSGIHRDGNVGLAHRRLAIIDPVGGAQPVHNEDGSVALTYNGEVYNYVELRRELEADFAFTTNSDTEVVLRAYEKWGIACLDRFRGMFALALHDRSENALYLVRDRAGIKPLYYYAAGGRIVFASEIGAILQADGVQRDVDPEGLSGYFRYQYVPAPRTIYRNLFKVRPGHYLRIDTRTGAIEDRGYWNLTVRSIERSEADWQEELDALLDETIKIYVRSDVPFGAFLSGGIDSSLVSALMAKHLDEPVRSFTIGFREEEHSELPFAEEASRTTGTRHYARTISPDLAEERFATLVRHFGEPFSDSSAVPTFYVSQEAAARVKMVLSGDGGDELFGGYNSYQSTFNSFSGSFGSDAPAAPKSLMGFVSRCLRGRQARAAAHRNGAARELAAPFQADHDRQREIFPGAEIERLLVPGVPVAPPVSFAVSDDSQFGDPLSWFQAQDFKTYMVDDVLTKVDRMSMANSLEVRVPLLDHLLIELAFSLPVSLRIRMNEAAARLDTKYLLRKSTERFYSESFLARPKRGFGIPVVEWCKQPLRPLIESGLRDRGNGVFDWVRFDYVQSVLDDFYAGKDVLVARVWSLLMLDLWGRHVHRAA